MRWMVASLVLVAACGSSPELRRARERAAAALSPPPYTGVTRCGPAAPAPAPAAPDSDLLGFAGDAAGDAVPRIEGSLDKELIARPIRAHAPAFRACYQSLLAVAPDAAGEVNAHFVIVADGSVADVAITGFDPRLDACVCGEVLRIAFPAFGTARAVGPIVVSYPFVFGT